MRRPAQYLALVTLTTLLCCVAPGAATADEAVDAPVTQPDRVTLRGGGTTLVDVLANDSDPNGDKLEICRLDIPDGVPLNNGVSLILTAGEGDLDDYPEPLFVSADRYTPGTYEITYWACDYDYLTPATVTVTVKRTRPVRAAVLRPGVVRFTNPDNRRVRIDYYDPASQDGDRGTLTLAPRSSDTVRIAGRHAYWFAYARRSGDRSGDGYLELRRH